MKKSRYIGMLIGYMIGNIIRYHLVLGFDL